MLMDRLMPKFKSIADDIEIGRKQLNRKNKRIARKELLAVWRDLKSAKATINFLLEKQ